MGSNLAVSNREKPTEGSETTSQSAPEYVGGGFQPEYLREVVRASHLLSPVPCPLQDGSLSLVEQLRQLFTRPSISISVLHQAIDDATSFLRTRKRSGGYGRLQYGLLEAPAFSGKTWTVLVAAQRSGVSCIHIEPKKRPSDCRLLIHAWHLISEDLRVEEDPQETSSNHSTQLRRTPRKVSEVFDFCSTLFRLVLIDQFIRFCCANTTKRREDLERLLRNQLIHPLRQTFGDLGDDDLIALPGLCSLYLKEAITSLWNEFVSGRRLVRWERFEMLLAIMLPLTDDEQCERVMVCLDDGEMMYASKAPKSLESEKDLKVCWEDVHCYAIPAFFDAATRFGVPVIIVSTRVYVQRSMQIRTSFADAEDWSKSLVEAVTSPVFARLVLDKVLIPNPFTEKIAAQLFGPPIVFPLFFNCLLRETRHLLESESESESALVMTMDEFGQVLQVCVEEAKERFRNRVILPRVKELRLEIQEREIRLLTEIIEFMRNPEAEQRLVACQNRHDLYLRIENSTFAKKEGTLVVPFFVVPFDLHERWKGLLTRFQCLVTRLDDREKSVLVQLPDLGTRMLAEALYQPPDEVSVAVAEYRRLCDMAITFQDEEGPSFTVHTIKALFDVHRVEQVPLQMPIQTSVQRLQEMDFEEVLRGLLCVRPSLVMVHQLEGIVHDSDLLQGASFVLFLLGLYPLGKAIALQSQERVCECTRMSLRDLYEEVGTPRVREVLLRLFYVSAEVPVVFTNCSMLLQLLPEKCVDWIMQFICLGEVQVRTEGSFTLNEAIAFAVHACLLEPLLSQREEEVSDDEEDNVEEFSIHSFAASLLKEATARSSFASRPTLWNVEKYLMLYESCGVKTSSIPPARLALLRKLTNLQQLEFSPGLQEVAINPLQWLGIPKEMRVEEEIEEEGEEGRKRVGGEDGREEEEEEEQGEEREATRGGEEVEESERGEEKEEEGEETIERAFSLSSITSIMTDGRIGRMGGFGLVSESVLMTSERGPVVVKKPLVLTEDHRFTSSQYRSFLREIKVGKQMSHPNIVQCYGCVCLPHLCVTIDDDLERDQGFGKETIHGLMGVFELCNGGDFARFFRKESRGMDDRGKVLLMLRAVRDVCLGLEYLHSKKIAHLDVKMKNAGVCFEEQEGEEEDQQNGTNSEVVVKMLDFGRSRRSDTFPMIPKSDLQSSSSGIACQVTCQENTGTVDGCLVDALGVLDFLNGGEIGTLIDAGVERSFRGLVGDVQKACESAAIEFGDEREEEMDHDCRIARIRRRVNSAIHAIEKLSKN